MKRIVSLVLALSMVLGLCATSFAATFEDVENTKYAAAVEALVELEVVTGYPDETYRPEKEVNRAELAKMIVISMGLEEDAERAQADSVFTDESLKEGELFAWARGYVNTAAAAGVIKGYPTGDFKPEKTVTYAEALTMMLRALGYGNVMEQEGTWPTNAILKARELELTDDVKYDNSSDGAARGDIAILLWNMLRTPMWKITSENQGTGMTSEASKKMLNVKFPDYMYDDEATVASFEIEDGEVTLTLEYEEENVEDVVGTVADADLLRLLEGMKVSYLYNIEDEEFLTVTPLDEVVEGRVEADKKGNLEVNSKEYKGLEDVAEEGDYVVLLVDGKKVVTAAVLPETSEEIDDEDALEEMQDEIGEDALVIIEGEWAKAKDLKEGDVITEIVPEDGNDAFVGDESYYVVVRERVEGEFDSFTYEETSDEDRYYFEVDGEKYEAIEEDTPIYEYDEDEEDYVDVSDEAYDEFKDKKGKYFGEDVELALDYIGNVVAVYFGDVDKAEDSEYGFYVLTSEFMWDDSSREGVKYYAELADASDVNEEELTRDLYDLIVEGLELEDGTDSTYDALTEAIENGLEELLVSRVFPATENDKGALEFDADDFEEKYVVDFVEDDEEILDDDEYLVDTEYYVDDDTIVYTIKATIEENKDGEEEVVGIEVEVSEGAEALEGVTYAMYVLAYEDYENEEIDPAVKYVFVAEDAKSTDLNFGLVEGFKDHEAGVDKVIISGETYEIDEESSECEVGNLVSFRVVDGVATIRDVLVSSDIDDEASPMVEKVTAKLVTLSDGEEISIGRESVAKEFDDVMFVLGTAKVNRDTKEVEFTSKVEVLGEGLENVSFKKGDRLLQGKVDENVIAIIRGLDADDSFTAGVKN